LEKTCLRIVTTAANATWVRPLVNKTAIQRPTVWTSNDTRVAVKGVEYLNPVRTHTFESANETAVSKANSWGDIIVFTRKKKSRD
jgi:hypothetical protein